MYGIVFAAALLAAEPACHPNPSYGKAAAGCLGTVKAAPPKAASCYGGAPQTVRVYRTPFRNFAGAVVGTLTVRPRSAVETTVYYPETLGPADPCMPGAPRIPLPAIVPPGRRVEADPVYEQRCGPFGCYLHRIK